MNRCCDVSSRQFRHLLSIATRQPVRHVIHRRVFQRSNVQNNVPRSLSSTSSSQIVPRSSTPLSLPSKSALHSPADTIFALSTPPGRAAIAIIRISGPSVLKIYTALCPTLPFPRPRNATVRTLYHPASTTTVLDPSALLLSFPPNQSLTGEQLLELHVHGSPAIVRAVLRAIPCTEGVRYAEPGEFTRRALLAGRLDVTQAEALGAVLAAETEVQRATAVRGAQGVLGREYENWRGRLVEARGELEALIDFAEDQQFEEPAEVLVANVRAQVRVLRELVGTSVANAARGRLLRDGILVTVLGRPNAGKSSLLNVLAGRDAAIVSNVAGTTRDIVEIGIDLEGWLVRFGDTAGLRSKVVGSADIDTIEQEGMKRAIQRAEESDVAIFLVDATNDSNGLQAEIPEDLIKAAKICIERKVSLIVALNKVDVAQKQGESQQEGLRSILDTLRKSIYEQLNLDYKTVPFVAISCTQAASSQLSIQEESGIKDLHFALTSTFKKMTTALEPSADPADSVFAQMQPDMSLWQDSLGTTERQRLLLQECTTHLDEFLDLTSAPTVDEASVDVVLAAESLRSAANCLGRITGRGDAGDVEDVLGVVFEK
ncbi:small GTP-binding protein [Microthyrium microscopicum]|uniref:Small GTP-binding protein n=1 Tax=Microthyrium microscopicum TaxID=703497 RepID=A0A6A6UJI5_9PEZI|nr:small GTP-binding protein [Microthyrium microscopicum]